MSLMNPDLCARLRADLEAASGELKAHMATWEYAFAMAARCTGAGDHATHAATRARTTELEQRCRDLRARLSEHIL
jgi:hypothetical protein